MDNRYLSNVIAEMKPFLDENGFTAESENVYVSENRKIEVSYNEARQMFVLSCADKGEEGFGEMRELTAWLFDDSQTAKDAESVGIDFVDTLRSSMGIKAKKFTGAAVELPTASKNGGMDITGFAKKVLDIYPKLKDPYKEHIEQYGNFLYVTFFADNLVPCFIESLQDGNNRAKKKIFDLCESTYIKGDKETINTMIACLAAACYKDEKAKAAIMDMLSADTHLKSSVESLIPMLTSKKLKATFLK